jgi:hypothetical protein
MTTSTSRICGILAMLVIVGLLACEEPTEATKHLESDQSWFPLDPQKEWRYDRWIAFVEDNPPGQFLGMMTLSVQNEVTVDGKVYREIKTEDGTIDKIVRVEGTQYFARNHELYLSDFSHEYVFLDTDKAVGESWHYIKDEGNSKTEYVIQAKDATHIIQGKEYTDVIEVKVNYYNLSLEGEFEKWASVIHFYARGVGEIYHYYPYPTLMYGDVSSFLLDDKE